MKLLIPLTLVIFMSSCAPSYPPAVHLDPAAPDSLERVYDATSTLTLRCRDRRANPEILVYRVGDQPPVRLPSDVGVQQVLAERLKAGFEQQGLRFAGGAPNHIEVEIKELKVEVSKPEMLYVATARSRIVLTVHSSGKGFTKNYSRTAEQSSMGRPDTDEATAMLDEQLSDIIARILADRELQTMLST